MNTIAKLMCVLLVMSSFLPAALGQTVVGPGEVLSIASSTADSFILAGGTLSPRDVTLSGPIELQSASTILRPQNDLVMCSCGGPYERSTGPTNLTGIIGGSEDLILGNESIDQIIVSGDNTYSGHTTITSGQIIVTTATAFGSSAGTTTIQGGSVTVQAATDEQFRVEGGSLFFGAGDFVPSDPITIAGGSVYLPQRDLYTTPVMVDGPGGAINFGYDYTASWTGGSSGVGSLTLGGRVNVDAPLTHHGDLILDGVKLNTANTYTGKTIITDDHVMARADAYGTSTTPIEVLEGTTTVNVIPNGNRGFIIERGTLNVQTTEPVHGAIVLGGGFEASIKGLGTFNGPLDYITTPGGGTATLRSGVFNGPIRGTTDLSFGAGDGVVVLNAANQIKGRARVRGGTVEVNHEDAIDLSATQIESGILELNVPAMHSPFMTGPEFSGDDGKLRLNVAQEIEDTWTVDTGTVEPAVDVSFQHLRLLGQNGPARIVSTEEGSIEVAGDVVAYGSSEIGGKVTGDGNIRSVVSTLGNWLNVGGNLSEFTGDFQIERGAMLFGRSTPEFNLPLVLNPAAEIHVYPNAFAQFHTGDFDVENDIFLHNANGTSVFPGALLKEGNGTLTLAGRIDVGDKGSTLADDFAITGVFTGNNLTLKNRSLDIRSSQRQMKGTLRLADGSVVLSDEGEFHGLDEIVLDSNQNKGISLQPSSNTDRIDDNTLIRSLGGGIGLNSSRNLSTSEVLGTLRLERGRTSIFASSDHGGLEATLTIDTVDREPGTILHFDEAGYVTSTKVNHIETFDSTGGNRMIGAWAVTDQGFASIDEDGFIGTLQPTSSDLSTAGPDDYVQVSGNQSLSDDLEIGSLRQDAIGNPLSFDLNGHLLTLRSGGIFHAERIENGSITAGDGRPAELIIHNASELSANVIDNGQNGAVSLVVADNISISGNNSYSGGTFILGDEVLIIEALQAIPANDRVFVDGGRYDLRLQDEAVVRLAELHLHNDGTIAGYNAKIDADEIYLEHGQLNLPLIGDGVLYKDSDGTVSFGSSKSPNFSGQVVVREGTLSIKPEQLSLATYQIEGGRISFLSGVLGEIHLNGGALQGGSLQGDIYVDSDSTMIGEGSATNLYGKLIGDANLTIDGRLDGYFDGQVGIFGDTSEFHGNFDVRSGPLRIGSSAVMGDSTITVHEGGRLVLASDKETSPATQVDNKIHLYGGTLLSTPPRRRFDGIAPPSFATGDVYVHDEAFIGATWRGTVNGEYVPGMNFSGRLILEDGANVYGLSNSSGPFFYSGEYPLVGISGELLVGENTSWTLGTASLLISGRIVPTAAESSLDFLGVETSLVLRNTELVTMAGKSLVVKINGEVPDLTLSGEEGGISGDGTFTGNIDFSDGATISPGNSPGMLTIIGDTTLGSGSIYDWEIASASGTPGKAWDLLQVDGDLLFTATAQDPWVLEISDLPGFNPAPAQSWLIATANNFLGFDPTAVEFDLTGIIDTWPTLTQENLVLIAEGSSLYLQSAPEPASWLLAVIGIVVASGRRRINGCNTGLN